MKITKIITLGWLIFILLLVGSCDKKDEILEALSNLEAKELVESSLQKSTAGFNTEIEEISEESLEDYAINLDCDVQYQNDFERHYTGSIVTANYDVNWSYQMDCNDLSVPQSINFSASSDGSYNTQIISSQDRTESSISMFGLQPTSDNLTLSGYFRRIGTQELSVLLTRQVNSTVEIMFTDIIVNKETHLIDSGNATIILTGTTTEGQTFSFTGSLIFNGQRTATLTINGDTYTIDLN
jgi:hypothetical protein